ncbi:DUF4333 domain-containing protein [Blastococcus sp. TBT05-19]|uniref:DUF4333 domain-containing protein n=1 Tax=Blastococcus sp. TBT05-19 TaxID=2250581 RepID=UPI0013145904|nr:DUF4333 domain-containing protein [Blastococcus sp. TBT05-19]
MTTVPRPPRMGRLWALFGVVLALALAPVLLARFVGPDPLDPAVVERDIAAEYEEQRGVALELDCPADMPVTSGEGYTCHGVTADGEPVSVWIQIDDSEGLDGSYTWGVVPAPVTPPIPAPSPGG